MVFDFEGLSYPLPLTHTPQEAYVCQGALVSDVPRKHSDARRRVVAAHSHPGVYRVWVCFECFALGVGSKYSKKFRQKPGEVGKELENADTEKEGLHFNHVFVIQFVTFFVLSRSLHHPLKCEPRMKQIQTKNLPNLPTKSCQKTS